MTINMIRIMIIQIPAVLPATVRWNRWVMMLSMDDLVIVVIAVSTKTLQVSR